MLHALYFVTKFNEKTGSGQRYEGPLQVLQMRFNSKICRFDQS